MSYPEPSANKILNVGGNNKKIPIPSCYTGWDHILLDINPGQDVDVVSDARQLDKLAAEQYQVVYCSHNLEHYYHHDAVTVLNGFKHVLKKDGAIHLFVPDMEGLMKTVVEKKLDIDDVLYQSDAGPIMVRDVIYGYGAEIKRTGSDFYAHKTGFTQKSLTLLLTRIGFARIFSRAGDLQIEAIAFKAAPSQEQLSFYNLPSIAEST
jgi:hypothetical protein